MAKAKAATKPAKKAAAKPAAKKPAAKKPAAKKAAVAKKRVKFEFVGQPGLVVSVAGSFNEWNSEDKIMKDKGKDGNYALSVLLPKEKISYKFIVDGAWIADPANPAQEADGHGGVNSIMDVN